MLRMHRKIVRRTFQCDVAGCRNRTSELDSRRADTSANPMHICDQCVIDLFVMRGLRIDAEPSVPEVPDLSPTGSAELNGGLAAVVESIITVPEELDTFDPSAGLAETHPPDEPKEKTVAKAARKPAGAKKGGSKAKTGGKA